MAFLRFARIAALAFAAFIARRFRACGVMFPELFNPPSRPSSCRMRFTNALISVSSIACDLTKRLSYMSSPLSDRHRLDG